MTAKDAALQGAITLFFLAVVAASFLYGPSRRSYPVPPTVLRVENTEELARAWERSGVRGRTALCFTRYLNALPGKDSPGLKVTERSLERGVLRRVFHVAPDAAWGEISAALSRRNGVRRTDDGYLGIFDAGRVYIKPLSRFSRLDEKALVVVEPGVWSAAELQRIAQALDRGLVAADLVVVVRGSRADAELFRHALHRQPL